MADFLDKIRDLLKPYRKGTEPLEIRRAILDEVQSRVISGGVGKRIFPYNRIRVHLLAAGPEERDELEIVTREAWDLQTDIAERLRELEAKTPADLAVEVAVTDQPSPAFGDRRFRLEFQKADAAPAAGAAPVRPILEVTILKGVAGQRVYTFPGPERINLGRLDEVVDDEGRVRRRNDVAFLEEGDISTTVSREQARLAWDDEIKSYRLRAEPGASATRILRDGRSIDVSPQDRRGVKVQSGDEIYLGRACLKLAMRTEEAVG